ncbi:hypothetical protein [Desulfoscipio geothermicus]|uniref:Uncharacterized protein n=1 Tax=Desulfoscipio geothermicus DSM 3669 TaxID=1121426 RepID=A0A1I6DSN9_9FIRM|nr:hypothetical protein [Desulfoscipio geothermicus]SFR08348.1 hypothetical protein SAMN05660706_11665 [Desulfoscipio geothermicus DSM 3669]
MTYNVSVRVDKDNSIDPSYIIHYRVTEGERLIGDGIVEYHRQAEHNNIPVSENIPPAYREEVKRQIVEAATRYIAEQR